VPRARGLTTYEADRVNLPDSWSRMPALPTFRYHPDPLATGSIVSSAAACACCGRHQGYVYIGPVYAAADLDSRLCPWCIADGSAAKEFEATFVDPAGIGDYGAWEPVPAEVITQVAERTPGFSGWQQERWWTHCKDAAAFLGMAGVDDLNGRWTGALPAIQADSGQEGPAWEAYLAALHPDQGPTAYVFQCLTCGQLGGYSDCH